MLYKLLNKRVKNRVTSSSNLYSVSFSNTKLNWRHAKVFKKLYGKPFDMVFTISHAEEGARSDTVLGFKVKKANDETFQNINQQLAAGLDDESRQIIKDIIAKRFGDFIGRSGLNLDESNVTFFDNKFICVRFEETIKDKLKSDRRNHICYIFCNSFDLEVTLFVFSENEKEVADIMADFKAIVSSIKISDAI